jgi:hypothetical protein
MLRRKPVNHEEIVLPEQDAAVFKAKLTLDRVAGELAVAEGELKEAEVELGIAEENAAQAIVDDQSAIVPIREREAVALRRDGLRLLQKAHAVAKQKHAEASHMANTSFTSVGNCADSPEPLLRPSPAMGHDAEILGVCDPDLGYDAEKVPYKPPQREIRPTCRTGLLGRLYGNISIYSIVRPYSIIETGAASSGDRQSVHSGLAAEGDR